MLGMTFPLKRQDVQITDDSKMVDVTITIVSLAGLCIHEAAAAGSSKATSETTIVAQVSSSGQSPITRNSSPITTFSKKPSEAIQWFSNESYKSITFRKHFEDTKFLLSKCSIDLAISRDGKRYPLGSASLVINGEERQMTTLHVPIDRVYPIKSKIFTLKKNVVPMYKPDGEPVKYGLANDATMRVIVQVEAASADAPAPSINDESSHSIFSFNTESSKSKTTITEYSMPSSKNDAISVGTLRFDEARSYNVMREISGLTSYWCDNLSLDTEKSTASGSIDEVVTIETIPSTDSESGSWPNRMLDDESLPSQFGVEVVPFRPHRSPCEKTRESEGPRVSFGPVEEYSFTAESSHRILVTLPSKKPSLPSKKAKALNDEESSCGKSSSVTSADFKQGARLWVCGLKQNWNL